MEVYMSTLELLAEALYSRIIGLCADVPAVDNVQYQAAVVFTDPEAVGTDSPAAPRGSPDSEKAPCPIELTDVNRSTNTPDTTRKRHTNA